MRLSSIGSSRKLREGFVRLISIRDNVKTNYLAIVLPVEGGYAACARLAKRATPRKPYVYRVGLGGGWSPTINEAMNDPCGRVFRNSSAAMRAAIRSITG